MQEYTDDYGHHFVEMLLDIAEISRADPLAQ